MLRHFRFFRLVVTCLVFGAPPVLKAQLSPRDSAFIVSTTQALLDAVTNGDSTIWARHLAPEWFLSDEEGEHLTRAEFLAGLHPLPPGQEGKLSVANPYMVESGNVAVLSYDAREEHHFYGQLLLTTFHITDTWIRRNSRWLLLAEQATALPQPILGAPLAPSLLHAYVGEYTLTPDIALSIVLADSGIVIRRAGRPDQPLYALDDRLFVRHGVRGFWAFERDPAGAVTSLVNWRDNNSVRWTRRH